MNPRPDRLHEPRMLKAMRIFEALQASGKQEMDADDIPSSKKVTSPSHRSWHQRGFAQPHGHEKACWPRSNRGTGCRSARGKATCLTECMKQLQAKRLPATLSQSTCLQSMQG